MRITPLDIRNHPFRRKVSGYDREEVDSFLRMVAEDYENVLRETESLREQLIKLRARVEDLSSNEKILQQTLTTAQKLGDDLKRTAVKESEVLISEAELKGEKILDAAHRRAAKLAEDIREMRSLRTRLASAVRTTIETHLNLLEGLESDPPQDPLLDGKVAYLGRNSAGAGPGRRSGGSLDGSLGGPQASETRPLGPRKRLASQRPTD